MGRPLRRHEPGQYILVTTRCYQSSFFLRPDHEVNNAILEWLTRAQVRFPDVEILAVCVMSNHLHLVVRDQRGELAAWAHCFFGSLAKAINRIRNRSGNLFERRYSAEPILDLDALVDRLVYTVTNPVAAGLCKRVANWPGVVLYATERAKEIPVTWVDRAKHRLAEVKARARRGSTPDGDEFLLQGKLILTPLPMTEGFQSDTASIEAAVEAREQQLAQDRRLAGRKTLTRRQVLSQNWRTTPSQPSRSPRPRCHASDLSLRKQFIRDFRHFVGLFREASERFRNGDGSVSFPLWCYPPGLPMIRVVSDRAVGAG